MAKIGFSGEGIGLEGIGLKCVSGESEGFFDKLIIFDASTGIRYVAVLASGASATQVAFYVDVTGADGWGTTPNLALAASDILQGSIIYEASS
jgi:hypothetical protein